MRYFGIFDGYFRQSRQRQALQIRQGGGAVGGAPRPQPALDLGQYSLLALQREHEQQRAQQAAAMAQESTQYQAAIAQQVRNFDWN